MSSTVESRLHEAQTRLHYMDNLRALAMIGGVFFHAALAYSPILHNFWLTSDSQQSVLVDVIAWFTHLFRMPLFFVIAGFFVAYLVSKRGMGGMLKNRALRILLPLIIFLPLCMWAVIAPMLSAAQTVQHKSPVLEMVAYAMANPGTPPPPPTTIHLWFLYNLIFFCVMTWVLSHYDWSRVRNFITQLMPLTFIALFPLVMVPALCLVSVPFPAPDSFLPQVWSFGFFGVFFTLGYAIFSANQFIEKFNSYWLPLLILSIGLYAIIFYVVPKDFNPAAPALPLWKKITFAALEAYISMAMTLVCLVLGKFYLNRPNKIMRFFSDSSYWIYIMHLPVLFAVQYTLLDKDWSLITKYGASLLVTFVLGIISYLALVRWTPIGWMLNGKRKRDGV
jgi:glucans biosynthesis protein C